MISSGISRITSILLQMLISLSDAEELHKPVRRTEKKFLNDLMKSHVRFPVKCKVQESNHKTYVLLQAAVSRVHIPDFYLKVEQAEIVEQCLRVLSALIDFSIDREKGQLLLTALLLQRALMTRAWEDSNGNIFLNCPNLSEGFRNKLKDRGALTIGEIEGRSCSAICNLLSCSDSEAKQLLYFAQYCRYYSMELSTTVSSYGDKLTISVSPRPWPSAVLPAEPAQQGPSFVLVCIHTVTNRLLCYRKLPPGRIPTSFTVPFLVGESLYNVSTTLISNTPGLDLNHHPQPPPSAVDDTTPTSLSTVRSRKKGKQVQSKIVLSNEKIQEDSNHSNPSISFNLFNYDNFNSTSQLQAAVDYRNKQNSEQSSKKRKKDLKSNKEKSIDRSSMGIFADLLEENDDASTLTSLVNHNLYDTSTTIEDMDMRVPKPPHQSSSVERFPAAQSREFSQEIKKVVLARKSYDYPVEERSTVAATMNDAHKHPVADMSPPTKPQRVFQTSPCHELAMLRSKASEMQLDRMPVQRLVRPSTSSTARMKLSRNLVEPVFTQLDPSKVKVSHYWQTRDAGSTQINSDNYADDVSPRSTSPEQFDEINNKFLGSRFYDDAYLNSSPITVMKSIEEEKDVIPVKNHKVQSNAEFNENKGGKRLDKNLDLNSGPNENRHYDRFFNNFRSKHSDFFDIKGNSPFKTPIFTRNTSHEDNYINTFEDQRDQNLNNIIPVEIFSRKKNWNFSDKITTTKDYKWHSNNNKNENGNISTADRNRSDQMKPSYEFETPDIKHSSKPLFETVKKRDDVMGSQSARNFRLTNKISIDMDNESTDALFEKGFF